MEEPLQAQEEDEEVPSQLEAMAKLQTQLMQQDVILSRAKDPSTGTAPRCAAKEREVQAQQGRAALKLFYWSMPTNIRMT
jgi:hypothetical protein